MQLQYSAPRQLFSARSCSCPSFPGMFLNMHCSLQTFGNYLFYAVAVLEVFRIKFLIDYWEDGAPSTEPIHARKIPGEFIFVLMHAGPVVAHTKIQENICPMFCQIP